MVAPGVSGLLFTVDPNQTGKAIRELHLYLDRFAPWLQSEVAPSPDPTTAASKESFNAPAAAMSLSAMLAAELSEFKRNDGEGAEVKRPRSNKREKLFSVLETNCKGYLFLNIPQPNIDENESDDDVDAGGESDIEKSGESRERKQPRVEGGGGSDGASVVANSTTVEAAAQPVVSSGSLDNAKKPLRVFSPNPLVTELVEKMFDELQSHPDRPVVRFTFRMYPCTVSCYPVVSSIVPQVVQLAEAIQLPTGRSAIKIAVILSVKNNTNVEKEKNKIREAIERCLPMNKFLVLPAGRKGIELDGLLHVCVIHSTCCIGYAPEYSKRKEYNIHDFGNTAKKTAD